MSWVNWYGLNSPPPPPPVPRTHIIKVSLISGQCRRRCPTLSRYTWRVNISCLWCSYSVIDRMLTMSMCVGWGVGGGVGGRPQMTSYTSVIRVNGLFSLVTFSVCKQIKCVIHVTPTRAFTSHWLHNPRHTGILKFGLNSGKNKKYNSG